MWIDTIELNNFRNYENQKVIPGRGMNIFYGKNAQGKTNFLESIYLCSTARSHRNAKDREMIRFGEEEAHIKMLVHKKENQTRIDMHLKENKSKGIAVNRLPVRKASELFGVINVIFFSPEDLSLIKQEPSQRRKFMDTELCQLDHVYVYDLIQYNKTVSQRNALLKGFLDREEDRGTLSVWDEQLVKYGKAIIEKRERFLEELSPIIKDIHRDLTEGKEEIRLIYEPNAEAAAFSDLLFINRKRDEKLRTTTTGPHRDDIRFEINGIDIRKYGSQGQQRTAAISLKLSEIALIEKRTGQVPILLLDDVLSELDSARQRRLLDGLKDVQTMITCTGLDELVEHRASTDHIFEVKNGHIFAH